MVVMSTMQMYLYGMLAMALAILHLGCIGSSRMNETELGPRIGDGVTSASYRLIKISERVIIQKQLSQERGHYVIQVADVIEAIGNYRKQYAQPLAADTFKDSSNPEEKMERYRTLARQCLPEALEELVQYLEQQPDDLTFTSHYGPQYDYGEHDWADPARNMVIAKFIKSHNQFDFNPYLLLIRRIPTQRIGTAKYRFTVGGETMSFRSRANKRAWSFIKKFWGYATIFSTQNGIDQAPLLIRIQHPMDAYSDNGYYIAFPK